MAVTLFVGVIVVCENRRINFQTEFFNMPTGAVTNKKVQRTIVNIFLPAYHF